MLDKKGFTLIELIIIIIILGILAAVAIPKYMDMSENAKKAVAESVLGSLRGAETITFANYLLNGTTYTIADVIANVQVDGASVAAHADGTGGTITVGSKTYTFIYTAGGSSTPGQFTKGGTW